MKINIFILPFFIDQIGSIMGLAKMVFCMMRVTKQSVSLFRKKTGDM
jgi:hypothetical protein